MTVRDLFDMVRRYGLNPDAELMVRPLLKDKPRKVTNIETGTGGVLTLTCSKISTGRKSR